MRVTNQKTKQNNCVKKKKKTDEREAKNKNGLYWKEKMIHLIMMEKFTKENVNKRTKEKKNIMFLVFEQHDHHCNKFKEGSRCVRIGGRGPIVGKFIQYICLPHFLGNHLSGTSRARLRERGDAGRVVEQLQICVVVGSEALKRRGLRLQRSPNLARKCRTCVTKFRVVVPVRIEGLLSSSPC